jgi:N-acetylmuramoyl-L-alanine amidase
LVSITASTLPLAATAALVLAACSGAGAPAGRPAPAPHGPAAPLPAVPEVDGALRIRVVYPLPDAPIAARDSNFIFGAVGTGRAVLRINGAAVDVAANGAFLAFLPVPADGVYVLEAIRGADTTRAERTVRLPDVPQPEPGAYVHAASAYPAGAWALPFGEPVEVGFLGRAGGRAVLRLPWGERIALEEVARGPGAPGDAANFLLEPERPPGPPSELAWYRGVFAARGIAAAGGTAPPLLRAVEPAAGPAVLELAMDGDTATLPLPLELAALDPTRPRVGIVTAPPGAAADWEARGRPAPSGPFHWFWPPGTRVTIDGERNGMLRVRLARDLAAWVPAGDVALLPQGAAPGRARVGGVRLAAHPDRVDVRIPLGERLPYRIDGADASLTIDVYGATSETNFFQYGSLDPLVAGAMWSQPADGVYRVQLRLAEPVWGWRAGFDATDALVVSVRRPPRIGADRPLAGLRIAVDPGHPPAGSTGPTGLTEAEANLAIAQRLRPMLEAAGATVVMTRVDAGPVELGARPRMAVEADAHVLLSIHNNAFPDGVNPWANAGTSVYFYQPHSLDLAREVQAALLAELGTRDIGIGRADLALVRPTWMPSILSESLYMMIPEHEAALRDATVQTRIARAHVRGLEAFLRGRASR